MRKRQAQQLHEFLQQRIESGKWCSTDVGVQNQALRLISLFAPKFQLDQATLELVMITLEGLLHVVNIQVKCKAAELTAALVPTLSLTPTTQRSLLQRLVARLAHLLSSSTPELLKFAAIALKHTVERAKFYPGELDNVLKNLSTTQAVRTLASILEKPFEDPQVLIACSELEAVLLERLPNERVFVGCQSSFRSTLLKLGTSSNELLVQASVKVLSSLSLCSTVATLIIQDVNAVLEVLKRCLSSAYGKLAALHFLVSLMNFSNFLSLIEQYDIGIVASECVEVLRNSNILQSKRASAEDDSLSLLAACATSLLLSVPGKHQLQFIQAGLLSVLLSALLQSREELYKGSSARRRLKSGFLSYLWQSDAWIGYHCNKSQGHILFEKDNTFETLLCRSCGLIFRDILCRNPDVNTQEAVQICHSLLLLLASSSCSQYAVHALEINYNLHGSSALADVRTSLELIQDEKAQMDTVEIWLCGASVFSHILRCKTGDISLNMLKPIAGILRERYMEDGSRFASPFMPSLRVWKPCCSEGYEGWSGRGGLLFSALWAVNLLLQNLDKDDLGQFQWMVDFLSALAQDTNECDGIRWSAALALTKFGRFGYRSSMGECLRRLLEESVFSDVTFVFADGSCLRAHRVILAGRCPDLLPDKDTDETTVRVSQRVSRAAMKSVLEYIYTGFVELNEGVLQDVKLLARKCRLEDLAALLKHEVPGWGKCLDARSLESAIQGGSQFSDIVLRSHQSYEVHAHRAVLSCRSDYFGALFRSGMRDSSTMVIEVRERKEVIASYLHYIYTDELKELASKDCAWRALSNEQQWEVLERLIDLASLAEQWLHEELVKLCVQAIVNRLKYTLLLCPRVMQHAAEKQQWEIVQQSAYCMAPRYQQLRETGALDILEDELVEMLRTCSVSSSLVNS